MVNYSRLTHLLGVPRGNHHASLEWMTKVYFPRLCPTMKPPVVDIHGNFTLEIPLTDGTPSATMFVAHWDTVDNSKLLPTQYKQLVTDKTALWLDPKHHPKGSGYVLGADDGAGMEVITCLAEAGVPGFYMWSAQEESGCLGTKGFIDDNPELLKRFERVICFDRREFEEIITAQMGYTTCSTRFAQDLADKLGMDHKPSPHGCFTDSKPLAEHIPECTNVSVGYSAAHTTEELLDLEYLEELIQQTLKVDWESLVTERTPVPAYETSRRWGSWDSGKPFDRRRLVYLLETYPASTVAILDRFGLAEDILDELEEELQLAQTIDDNSPKVYDLRDADDDDDYEEYLGSLSALRHHT
jgi:hypothetical protein